MRCLLAVALAVACLGLASTGLADDKDVTGTWKWSVTFNDQTREMTLKLKLEGDKLTGSMLGRNNQETPIEDGKIKDGQVSFKITRERDGNKFITKYEGKLSGDTIKGKSTSERDGQPTSRDWEAKKQK